MRCGGLTADDLAAVKRAWKSMSAAEQVAMVTVSQPDLQLLVDCGQLWFVYRAVMRSCCASDATAMECVFAGSETASATCANVNLLLLPDVRAPARAAGALRFIALMRHVGQWSCRVVDVGGPNVLRGLIDAASWEEESVGVVMGDVDIADPEAVDGLARCAAAACPCAAGCAHGGGLGARRSELFAMIVLREIGCRVVGTGRLLAATALADRAQAELLAELEAEAVAKSIVRVRSRAYACVYVFACACWVDCVMRRVRARGPPAGCRVALEQKEEKEVEAAREEREGRLDRVVGGARDGRRRRLSRGVGGAGGG